MNLKLKSNLSRVFQELSEISDILKEDLLNISDKTSKKSKKLNKWLDMLNSFLLKHENIQLNLKTSLEKKFSIKFKNSDLITLALFRPSTKNIFTELSIYFREEHPNFLNIEHLGYMSNLGDIAEGLALLGDRALDLAVTHTLWEKGITDKGIITKEKEKVVENPNLAKYCDDLDLYHNRIHMEKNVNNTKPETIIDIKATLVEAIIGIIYLEKEVQGVINFLKKIKENQV